MSEREALGVADLNRVWFYANDEAGAYVLVNAETASRDQFDEWARLHVELPTTARWVEGLTWPPKDRAFLCDFLWRHEAIVLLRKEETSAAE